ncbi:hypothetical protein Tco_1273001 [Tanacetum coccineum]
MGEPTIEEYMTKTREDYGSGIVRPKIDDKARFELKAQFFKELQDNTFSGSDNEDANEHIEKKKYLSKYCPPARTTKKMEGINNFQQELDETLYQAWKRFKELQILDSKGAIPCMNVADEKKAIQEMANHSQKWHNRTSTRRRSTGTSDGLAAIQAQLNNNLGREIKKGNLEICLLTKTNPRDHVKSISTTIETDTTSIRRIGGDLKISSTSTLHSTLEDRKIVLVAWELRERMKLDLEVRLMGEALMINRSQDPSFKDFIELNDPNTPIELRRNQVEDLGPTIGEEVVIDKPMIDIIKTRNNESFDEYPSFCDFDGKIHIDCAYNLRFLCMIVVKNMDGYRDQDIGDVIFGEPLCKASCVEARRFE